MQLYLCVKTCRAASGEHLRLEGWEEEQAGPVETPVTVALCKGQPDKVLVRLTIEPERGGLSAAAAGGSLHYFRLADATLKPLPAEAVLTLARGDAYIALSPGAERLAGRVPIARFLHLRDYFNAERLAEGVLAFLAQVSGEAEFPADISVIVVEAR